MGKIGLKRVTAYFIDLLIIMCMLSLINNIKILNPYNAKYEKALINMTNFIKTDMGNMDSAKDLMNNKEYLNLFYNLKKYNLFYSIQSIVTIVLYFTLFPFFFNGQTIGKKICKLKVVDSDGNTPNFFQYLLRTMLLPVLLSISFYVCLPDFLECLLYFITGKTTFIKICLTFESLGIIYSYGDVIASFFGRTSTSLHDKICHTKVIVVEE